MTIPQYNKFLTAMLKNFGSEVWIGLSTTNKVRVRTVDHSFLMYFLSFFKFNFILQQYRLAAATDCESKFSGLKIKRLFTTCFFLFWIIICCEINNQQLQLKFHRPISQYKCCKIDKIPT